MGMFSFVCKGCGHELKEGEYVRLNGCVGTYDGYGGAGGFDYSGSYKEPSAWHIRCYNNASNEDKLNDDPSEHASNQGFGAACLENREHYDPEAKTVFQATIFVDHHDWKNELTIKQQWYVVDGVLVDQERYESLYELANSITDKMCDELPDDWHSTTSDEDRRAFYQKVQETVENHIGMKRPCTNAQWFDDFEEAKRTVESLIPSLSNPEWGYSLMIYGKQEKAEGLYYQYNKTPNWDTVPIPGEYYTWGDKKQKMDFVFNGTFDEQIAFMHNRPAIDGVPSF